MRTVCASKGDQSPLTRAVRSSTSVRLPLPIRISALGHVLLQPATYCSCRRRQTASTAPHGRSRRGAGRVWVGVVVAEKWAACRGSSAGAGHGRSWRGEASPARRGLHSGGCRGGGRIAGRCCMRPAGVCCRSWQGARRSGRRDGSRGGCWESRGQACCSLGALSWFVGAGRATASGRASAQPGDMSAAG